MGEWQTIDEAPEPLDDGDGNSVCYLTLYAEGSQPECGHRMQVSNGHWLKQRGKEYGVTHWMPLPEPPLKDSP